MSLLGSMFCFISRAADIRTLILFTSLFIFSGLGSTLADTPRPGFTVDERIEQSLPYLTLSWGVPTEVEPDPLIFFELEMARADDFSDVTPFYRGSDRATFVAGLAEGDYHFRIRSFRDEGRKSAWSDPMHLTIEYESLTKAFLLFGVGAVVSIATVALVVTGDRRMRREEANIQ